MGRLDLFLLLLLSVAVVSCGGDGGTSTGPTPTPTTVPTTTSAPPTTSTTSISGPATVFGPGQHMVGTDIQAGRYFNDPISGCYWERLSGLGGNLSDIIANEFIAYDAMQWIVEIAPSDMAFDTEDECRSWYMAAPRHEAQADIPPGMWLVNRQIRPGMYQGNVQFGCYWARLRGFTGTFQDIRANDFITTPGARQVEIKAGDAGFESDADCGTWTFLGASMRAESSSPDTQSPADIERNWRMYRQRWRR